MAINDVSLTAGMRVNLISLQETAKLMSRTTERLSTGKKINSPIDGPIAYFTAQNHTQRASDLSLLKDGMSEAIQTIQMANTGMKAITELIASAKAIASSAKSDLGNVTLQDKYNDLLQQIADVAEDSKYLGINLLQGGTAGTGDTMTVTFNEATTANTLVVDGVDISIAAGVVTINDTDAATPALATLAVANFANAGTINTNIGQLDTALAQLRTISYTLSANLSIITTRQEFTQNLINNLLTGADNLTLADMNEESANMLMLQTRQALGVSSLGMATESAQAILRLF